MDHAEYAKSQRRCDGKSYERQINYVHIVATGETATYATTLEY